MLWSVFRRISSAYICVKTRTKPFHLSPLFTFPLKNILACNALSHLTATHLYNCNWILFRKALYWGRVELFFLREKSAFFFLPQHQRLTAAGDKVLSPGTGLSDSTEKSPRFAEHLVHHSQGSTYLRTEEIFPPARGGETFLAFSFLCSMRVGGNPPGDPSSRPVILPVGSLPAESCFMLLTLIYRLTEAFGLDTEYLTDA